MKKQDWVDRLMGTTREKMDKIRLLESGCDYYIVSGFCNGENGNCQTCPITIARKGLLGKLPEEREERSPRKDAPRKSVMVKVGRHTLNWKEV